MPNRYNLNQKRLTMESTEEALLILMQRKSFHEITVSELCTKAGISRMAFYRNFSSMKDVILQYLIGQQQGFFRQIQEEGITDQTHIGYEYLSMIEREKEAYKAIFEADLQWLLMDFMAEGINRVNQDIIHAAYQDDLQKGYMLSFYAGGYIALLTRWLEHDCRDDKDKIINLMSLHLDYRTGSL